MNYEQNRMIDGSLDLGSDKYNMSLTSSIRGIASKYIANVLIAINKEIMDFSRSGSNSSFKYSEIEQFQQVINKKEIDPVLKKMMSESNSASVADFEKDSEGGNFFAQVCTDVIEAKVQNVINAITGVESAFNNSRIEIGVNVNSKGHPKPLKDIEVLRERTGTNMSSKVTEGAAGIAKDYLVDMFGKATRQIDNDVDLTTENYRREEIEFFREVTEESLNNESKI